MKSPSTFLTTLLLLGTASAVVAAPTNPFATLESPDLGASGIAIAQSSTPTTYMTPQGPDEIVVQITDGNFYFRDVLHRTYGDLFQTTDHGYRVMYDRDSGRVTILFDETGAEVYNYFFTEASSGSDNSVGYSQPTPETYLTRENANEYTIELIEGEFNFSGTLTRSSGNTFVGSDGRVRVIYDADTGRIAVINVVTGTEFYNYFFSEADEGFL